MVVQQFSSHGQQTTKQALAEVIAAVPTEGGGDDLVLDTPIAVTEVTVVATDYKGNFDVSRSRTHFWVGDADGAIELYLDYMDPDAVPPFEIQVGQKISFNVTKVNRYFDKGQIVGVSDVVLVSDNAPVYLWTPDRALVVEDIHRVVRITGNLAGTGGECGAGNRCWDLDYGFGRAIFRSNSDFLQTGACVTFVGPLGLSRRATTKRWQLRLDAYLLSQDSRIQTKKGSSLTPFLIESRA